MIASLHSVFVSFIIKEINIIEFLLTFLITQLTVFLAYINTVLGGSRKLPVEVISLNELSIALQFWTSLQKFLVCFGGLGSSLKIVLKICIFTLWLCPCEGVSFANADSYCNGTQLLTEFCGADMHCDFCASSKYYYQWSLLALCEFLSSEVKLCRAKWPLISVAAIAACTLDIKLTSVSLPQTIESMKNNLVVRHCYRCLS